MEFLAPEVGMKQSQQADDGDVTESRFLRKTIANFVSDDEEAGRSMKIDFGLR
jgi:hypothetical protein